MTDNDLKFLKDLPVPEARADARSAALQSSLEAFAQGNEIPARRKVASRNEWRIPMMRSVPKMAIAASLLVCVIGVPATIHYMQNYGTALQGETTAQFTAAQTPAKVAVPPRLPPPSPAQPFPNVVTAPRAGQQQIVASGKVESETNFSRTMTLSASPTAPAASAVQQYRQGLELRDRAAMFRSDPSGVIRHPARPGDGVIIYSGQQDQASAQQQQQGRDRFSEIKPNPVKSVNTDPVSTFSIDVDTASYSFVRRAITAGQLPPKDAVRTEELINYFPYSYPLPKDRTAPFQPTMTLMPSPWNPQNQLLHIAIKGYDVIPDARPRANLIFLIDTSGSMQPADRLPLLKNSFKMLVETLKPDDTIGIVTYAGNASALLEPTRVAEKGKILAAIEKLQAGGSTAGAGGITEAYRMAESAYDKAAVNRIILGTDGDFNVGITDREQLKSYIERKRQSGIFLSILGVGQGNYNDALMQALAQNGNGTAAYIDTLNEARKVLSDEISSTLFPIAKDVKIQVEFNPSLVAEYRLIGYETRLLRREDFNNDKIDAGEIGSGHAVTAIYELTPVGAPLSADSLRYGRPKATPARVDGHAGEAAHVKIRYKLPNEDESKLIEAPVRLADFTSVEKASTEVRFSTAVAAYGQLLRGEPYLKKFGYDDVIRLANGAKGDDPFGYRAEFVNLARLAKLIKP
jgi:Ca-activated chloride channel homolog